MRKTPVLLFFTILFCITYSSYAQELSKQSDEIYTTHFYSFKDAASKEVVNDLQKDLLKMEFVKNVDITYSEIKKSGSITVLTLQKVITKENEEGFKPTSLKKCFLKHNITPLHYQIIEPNK